MVTECIFVHFGHLVKISSAEIRLYKLMYHIQFGENFWAKKGLNCIQQKFFMPSINQ